MSKKLAIAALAAIVSGSLAMPEVASAHSASWYRHHRAYRGNGGYYHRCNGGNGAVGTIAGGVGGALIGNGLGGGTLGTVAGGVGGALLGRHLDKQHTRHRNGC